MKSPFNLWLLCFKTQRLLLTFKKVIHITEAVTSWCHEWREHFDEKMKMDEANHQTRNSSAGPYPNDEEWYEDGINIHEEVDKSATENSSALA